MKRRMNHVECVKNENPNKKTEREVAQAVEMLKREGKITKENLDWFQGEYAKHQRENTKRIERGELKG